MYAVCIQYAVYNTNLSVKLCFSIQRTLHSTIAIFSNSVDDLLTELKKSSEKAIDWFCLKQI